MEKYMVNINTTSIAFFLGRHSALVDLKSWDMSESSENFKKKTIVQMQLQGF